MKVIAYSKRDLKDVEKVYKKNLEIQEERKSFPDRYPKPLSPDYIVGEERIRLYDGTEEQLANLMTRWVPEVSYRFVVIFEPNDSIEAANRIGLSDKWPWNAAVK